MTGPRAANAPRPSPERTRGELVVPNPPMPTVGRIVHYQPTLSPDTRPAIIVGVGDDRVDLVIFNKFGAHYKASVAHTDEPTPGYWSWPPHAGS